MRWGWKATIFTEANRLSHTVDGSNSPSGAHAGSPRKLPAARVRTLTKAGRNVTIAAGPLCRTNRGHGPVITTADGPRSALDAAGPGFRAKFGRHRGCRGGRVKTSRAIVWVGHRCPPKPAAN